MNIRLVSKIIGIVLCAGSASMVPSLLLSLYNRDGICRFSKVFDRGPSITEEDGCTEFVIRHTY